MKYLFELTQRLALLFSLTICMSSSAYAGLATILINSAAFTIGYSLNPLSWVLGAIGAGIGIVLSLPAKRFISKELPIGFGIGIGAGVAIARINTFYLGHANWPAFIAQTTDSGIHGLLGGIIYLVSSKYYRKIKPVNPSSIAASSEEYISYKFFVLIFLFVTFFGQVTRTLVRIKYSSL